MLTMSEVIFAACTALAMIVGAIMEWRRQSRQSDDHAALEAKVDGIEQRLSIVEAWRDRIGRTW